MSNPTSVATVKPIPTASPYGIDELELFTRFTRASYKEEFGIDAPPFDPTKTFLHNGKMVPAIKNWFDSDANPNVPTFYNSFATFTIGPVEEFILPPQIGPFIYLLAGLANIVNLPDDEPIYPTYVVADTQAYEADDGKQLTINKNYLSTIEEAEAFAKLIGNGTPAYEYQPTGGPSGLRIVYPTNELRRQYQFVDILGQTQIVGLCLIQANAWGVGCPVVWINDGQKLVCKKGNVPVVTTPPDAALVPMAIRQLESTETLLEPSVAGNNPMVANSASLTTK